MGGVQPHLPLQFGALEGEQEAPDVVLAQLVDAARVDGAAQELVHLVLGVEGLLGTAAAGGGSAIAGGDLGGGGLGGGGGLLALGGVIDALQGVQRGQGSG